MGYSSYSVLNYQELSFGYINDKDALECEKLANYNALVINCSDKYLYNYMMRRIRAEKDEKVSLKPVFLYNNVQYLDDLTISLIDGVLVDLDDLSKAAEITRRIMSRERQLKPLHDINYENYILTKAFRFLYVREKDSIEPLPDRNSKFGHSFPVLSSFYSFDNEYRIFDDLDAAETMGIVTGSFKDMVYACNNCFDSFLHYRESCSHCHSTDLQAQELIHHFPCAYIGPISDFSNASKNEDELQCPKCNKLLRHIGVDYDKPSMIYHCHKCNRNFQDVKIKCKCQSCGTDGDVEFLAKRTLKKYKLTQKGEYTATHGQAVNIVPKTIPGTVSMETFASIIQYEIERLNVADFNICLTYLHFTELEKLTNKVGQDTVQQLFHDIVYIIRNSIRKSDSITFYNSSTLLFSMTGADEQASQKILGRLIPLFKRLIKDNFHGFEAEINCQIHPLRKEFVFKEQLDALTTQKAR